MTRKLLALTPLLLLAACNQQAADSPANTEAVALPEICMTQPDNSGNSAEVVPGLSARILKGGYGRAAVAGDLAEVHYTGWLYDESADDNRGEKFDSSVDRGQPFAFPLGAGRVIRGWDQGVQCMEIGEKRELTIAPEMGYGDRGAGAVIPPGATLVFEVELLKLTGPDDAT